MHHQYCRRNEIKFLTDRVTLPLFLATRVSSKKSYEYKTRTEELIHKLCEEEKRPNTKMRSVYEKRIGKYAENPRPCINLRRIKLVRDHIDTKYFHLPPNIYETNKIPFETRRGLGGAYWHRSPTTKLSPDNAHALKWQFYNIPRDSDRFTDRHNHYKGKFRTSESKLTPKGHGTEWNSQSDLAENQNELAKDSQLNRRHLNWDIKSQNYDSRTNAAKPNPHVFLRNSCVPEKRMSYIPRHQSFQPAVGRYEIVMETAIQPVIQPATKRIPSTTTKKKLSHSQSITKFGTGDVRRRLLHWMLDAATLTQAKQFDLDDLEEPQMPIKETYIRFNSIIAQPRLKIIPGSSKRPAPRASTASKQFQLSRKKATVQRQFVPKREYKRNLKFRSLPSPKVLASKTEIFANIYSCDTPCFYFRKLDINKYLKKSTANKTQTKC
ncbi:uncharacterized protein LOC105222589 [Bactrocera dorsalis]|uniref:Uncharacterized protein LOC105222589 n=1 Tax=Bactrocera dorsalis TaxID=27457 RepID=A0ABM3JE19_BACDO|nr:uncharacterized protein LOC105222589 [Bactrocera dorsalis]